MARTPGATNKSAREDRAEAKRLTERAKHKDKVEKLKKKDEKK